MKDFKIEKWLLKGNEVVAENKKENWQKIIQDKDYIDAHGKEIDRALTIMEMLKNGSACEDALNVLTGTLENKQKITTEEVFLISNFAERGKEFHNAYNMQCEIAYAKDAKKWMNTLQFIKETVSIGAYNDKEAKDMLLYCYEKCGCGKYLGQNIESTTPMGLAKFVQSRIESVTYDFYARKPDEIERLDISLEIIDKIIEKEKQKEMQHSLADDLLESDKAEMPLFSSPVSNRVVEVAVR